MVATNFFKAFLFVLIASIIANCAPLDEEDAKFIGLPGRAGDRWYPGQAVDFTVKMEGRRDYKQFTEVEGVKVYLKKDNWVKDSYYQLENPQLTVDSSDSHLIHVTGTVPQVKKYGYYTIEITRPRKITFGLTEKKIAESDEDLSNFMVGGAFIDPNPTVNSF